MQVQSTHAPSGNDDLALRRQCESRLQGLRTNRYSWWVHWRELADYFLPRRYKWIITPNQQSRGSPINQHIIDSTPTLAARNLASGMMTGITDPSRPWFRLKINRIDSTQTSPISLWLAECERLLMLIFQESNFYNSAAVLYFDLAIFGTAALLIYDDYENVICCYNPCAGEYYLDNSPEGVADVFYREFTLTISAVVDEFGLENCPPNIQQMYREGGGALTREVVIAHALEPNDGKYGIAKHFTYREVYWVWGGSQTSQGGAAYNPSVLRKGGFYEKPHICPRWDLVSNDPYGRSPAMDALGDNKQLQQETRRKAQAIDKLVNPPMVADIQLKNQPASLLPGGVTYISGMTTGKVGFAPAYTVQPPVQEIMQDLMEVRNRIKDTFFNNLFQTISQYQTRSNISATEIDARRAESMVMLGPVLERLENEFLGPTVERVFAIAARVGILPPPPPEIQGAAINVQYVSMLANAQAATATAGIERILAMAGNLAGVTGPEIMDNIDVDYALVKTSSLLNNDPQIIRSPEQLKQIRTQRQQAQQQAAVAQEVENAKQLAEGAKTLSETEVGGGQSALQRMMAGGIGV